MEMASAPDIWFSHSLLPYLQGPHLKLSLFPAATPLRDKVYPFRVLDDTHPFSRSIEAVFLTDAGDVLKKVVLQIQKDRYLLPADELKPVTNLDIEEGWRAAFSQSLGERLNHTLLAAQLDAEGAPNPLDPLFYCRIRDLFFHPVCPSCGQVLSLCRDEEQLKRIGLASYARSHSRHLHCASCSVLGHPEFYLYELDNDDPVTVKDRWALIDRFGLVDISMNPGGAFPCVGCPQHKACFGPDHEVRTRIVPFSFYPFYLLVKDLPSLHGSDFLRLVSGARAAELADSIDPQRHPGRVTCLRQLIQSGGPGEPLFRPDDERSFLEILFLKLAFLSDLLLRYSARELADTRLRYDRIWVNLPPTSRELPRSWNFHLEMAHDICPAGIGVAPSEALWQLGILWIQVLCQNQKIDQKDIHTAVAGWLRNGPGPLHGATEDRCLAAILAPANIFWRPDGRRVAEGCLSFWDRAIAPVQLLLQAVRMGGAVPSRAELVEMVETLRGEVKAVIFAVAPAALLKADLGATLAQVAGPLPGFGVEPRIPEFSAGAQCGLESLAAPAHDPASGQGEQSILEKLAGRARGQLQPDPTWPAAAPQASFDDDETMETVILSPRSQSDRGVALRQERELCETNFPQRMPRSSAAEQAAALEAAGDCLLETMVAVPSGLAGRYLRPTAGQPGPRLQGLAPSPVMVEEDQMGETVCVSPPGGRRPRD
jgi:hypothetical protein